jgi:hypothetical protein
MLAALLATLALLAPAAPAAEPGACIHLKQDNRTFCVAFGDAPPVHAGIPPLPLDRAKAAADWASNATHAGVMSPAMGYRLLSRLATMDTREAHGFKQGPCAFGPWRVFEWDSHADHAFLGLLDLLGKDDPLIIAFEREALRAGVARKDPTFVIEFKEKRLTPNLQRTLSGFFQGIEKAISERADLSACRIPLQEKIEKEPWTKPTFMKFEIID